MTATGPDPDRDSFARDLASLRRSVAAELRRLGEERARLERLTALIDEYAPRRRTTQKARSGSRAKPPSLLELIRQSPGIRASMLAMLTGRTSEEIAAELAAEEKRGVVARSGLGWLEVDRADANAHGSRNRGGPT